MREDLGVLSYSVWYVPHYPLDAMLTGTGLDFPEQRMIRASLAVDIGRNGLLNPIILWNHEPERFATYVMQGQNRMEALKILGWQTAPVIATGECEVHQKSPVSPQDIQDYFPNGNITLRSDGAIKLKDTHPPDSYTYPRGTARYRHEDYWTPRT